ncbi:MAG: nitrate- and nitrite sensing domain-containing protein [Micromonosporaceae bacterium]|nr:nitrate- and nitrite sensing domain-containing protein [Micromonosporaceae bacterium]
MSTRPSTSDGLLSRLRRPFGRLRDLPIWSKLGLIMIVPTIATIVVGTNGMIGHIQDAQDADRARSLASLTEAAGALVHGLQDERAAAVILLGTQNQGARQNRLTAYRDAHSAVDAAQRPYAQRSAAVGDLPDNFDKLLRDISQELGELATTRSEVEAGKISISSAKSWYQVLINNLLTIADSAAPLAGDSSLSDRIRAAAALSREKEFLSLERTVVLDAFSQGGMTPKLKEEFISTLTGQQQALQSFQSVATEAERARYDQTVSGSALREANSRTGDVRELVGSNATELPFDETDWDTAMVGHAELLRNVEVELDRNLVTAATNRRDEVTRTVLVESGALLGMLLLAILFAWLVARSMARSLRELRQGALAVAQYGLPQAVARLRDPALSTQLSPQQVAAQIAEPLPVRSKDEFGQVTEAFNAVHLEAVRTAAEQAQLRSSVATMFVNLARRSQILVDRLIGHLDRLERSEEDPDALAELFQLDHLATRMRRNDENLLVLAGADSTRVQREPAALLDVLRAAQSEVEHYTRIEFGVIDRDIEVAAHAVNDLVHLLAELFDNATAFSPPDSHVVVEARRVGERASLYVEDHGIGISPEQLAELNERLATPPQVDVAVSRMMGLVVVSRLAARHGVKVELRRGPERGTIADVTLPTSVLVPRALVGRVQGAPHASGVGELGGSVPTSAAPARRPSFGGPLALESGPSAAGGRPAYSGLFADGPSSGGFGGPPAPGRGRPGQRPMPAWSDLTGASAASTNSGGPNGAYGSNGGPATSSLGAGANGEPFVPRTPDAPGAGPLPQRQAHDPWTVDGELADEAGSGRIPRQAPFSPEARSSLPRRPVNPPGGMPPTSAPPASDPSARDGRGQAPFAMPPQGLVPPMPGPAGAPPVSGPPAPASGPPPAAGPSDTATPPPAWPPVAPAHPGGEDAGATAPTPAVPEELAAALDMTAELPKVRPTEPDAKAGSGTPAAGEAEPASAPAEPASAPPAAAAPASAPPATPTSAQPAASGIGSGAGAPERRTPDETMELPIFRELESAWFRTRRPAAPSSAPTPTSGVPFPASSSAPPAWDSSSPARFEPVPGGNGTRSSNVNGTTTGSNSTMAATPMPAGGPSWQTAADEGWRAASAAAEVPVTETTEAGLPKRVPMAQLVPGGVERPATTMQRRTPEGVRGLLSAYHRGVQRGRSEPKDGGHGPGVNPQPSTAGPQQQGGKEQEA